MRVVPLNGNTGIVPPWLQATREVRNPGIVPPWLQHRATTTAIATPTVWDPEHPVKPGHGHMHTMQRW